MTGLLVSFLALPGLTFSGGSAQQFVSEVSAQTSQPAVLMLTGANQKLPGMSVQSEDPTDWRRLICTKLSLDSEPKSKVFGFGPAGWPRYFFKKQRSDQYLDGLVLDEQAIQGGEGKLTIAGSPNKCLSLDSFIGKLSRRVTWEPFFDSARFVVAATAADEGDVLKAVAASIGADLVTSKDKYEFRINAQALRRRIIVMGRSASTARWEQERKIEESDGRFLAVLVENMNDAELLGFYRNSKQQWLVKVAQPGSPIHNAALVRLNELWDIWGNQPMPSNPRTPYLKKVREEESVYGEIRPDGEVTCYYKTGDNQRWGG